MEKIGVPAAPIITDTFVGPVKLACFSKGMPNIRFTFIPHPVAYTTADVCRQKLLGKDLTTGKTILESIVDALTKPLTADDKKTGFIERPIPRMIDRADTEDNLQALFRDNGWTAYMPIILPTEERVAAMLKGTSHKRDEIVGEMRPSSPHEAWSYTVEKVAIQAVMAGAKPEFFPVILAIAASGATSLFTSTNSFSAMVCVNGPIRHEINMNMGIGAFGPFNHANASIGCAWTLMSKNLGNGGVPGMNYMGSQGQTADYNNLCFAEKEERLPDGWLPFHVQKGFRSDESVVSMFQGWNWVNIGGFETTKHLTIKAFYVWNTQCCGQTIVIDPLVAQMLYENGFTSKEQLTAWLRKEVGRNINVNIMVTGGETNCYWQGGSLQYLASASVDKWR